MQENPQEGPASYTCDMASIRKLRNIVKGLSAQEGDDFLYQEPEREAHRIVLFRKTKIPEPMVSYVIEVSLIDRRILIMANAMGLHSKDHRILLERKKSKELLDWAAGDYARIWERVHVTPSGIRLAEETTETLDQHKEGNGENLGERPGVRAQL